MRGDGMNKARKIVGEFVRIYIRPSNDPYLFYDKDTLYKAFCRYASIMGVTISKTAFYKFFWEYSGATQSQVKIENSRKRVILGIVLVDPTTEDIIYPGDVEKEFHPHPTDADFSSSLTAAEHEKLNEIVKVTEDILSHVHLETREYEIAKREIFMKLSEPLLEKIRNRIQKSVTIAEATEGRRI